MLDNLYLHHTSCPVSICSKTSCCWFLCHDPSRCQTKHPWFYSWWIWVFSVTSSLYIRRCEMAAIESSVQVGPMKPLDSVSLSLPFSTHTHTYTHSHYLFLWLQALINSTITANMNFTKTSPKFGQWSDHRANTVYGLGFSSEKELVQVRVVWVGWGRWRECEKFHGWVWSTD